jgi:hypothetical protein
VKADPVENSVTMKEFVLQYVWQHKLFVQNDLTTTDGEYVEIIDVGKFNCDCGPDFFNAKVRIGVTLWAGNIEIHVNSSDWDRHSHQHDEAYNTVILHVVRKADKEVATASGRTLPQLELQFPNSVEEQFEKLMNSRKWLPCVDDLVSVPSFLWLSWKNALLHERIARKANELRLQLEQTGHNFEEVFFRVLAKSYGFSINSSAFETLALSLPWHVVMKQRLNLLSLEALLLGQSGLLLKAFRKHPDDAYLKSLVDCYRMLQHKYRLRPMPPSLWRWLRLRPDNFPEIRIAQLAAIMAKRHQLFSELIAEVAVFKWRDILSNAESSDYWKSHYMAGVSTPGKVPRTGLYSLYGLIINAVIPLGVCYAEYKGDPEMKEKLIELLSHIPVENNVIIRNWKRAGVKVESAADSQALIQLYRTYCEPKNCLRCRIGHKVLTIG